MKRLVSIYLLCCLFGPPTATYTYWWMQKKAVQRDVKAQFIRGIPRDDQTLIRVAVKDAPHLIYWEKSDELVYAHQMYDVLESSRQGDTLYYWCWWDRKETRIHAQLHALIADALERDQPCRDHKAQLFLFFKSLFCTGPPNLTWAPGGFLPEPQSPVFPYHFPQTQARGAPPGLPPECIATTV